MKNRSLRTLALLAALLVAGARAGLAAPSPETLAEKIRRIVDEQAKRLVNPLKDEAHPFRAPGGIVGVYYQGAVLYFGYGRIDGSGTLPTKDTLFGLGSVTKTFTTSILGQSPALFGLSVSAGPLPPSYSLQPSEAPVTFEELATFTGGIPRVPDNCDRPGKPACDQALFVAFINGVTPPGGKLPAPNLYSNAGIGFLGQILMFQDGFTDFGPAAADKWYRKHLFDPLGMEHTSYPPAIDPAHPLADAYEYCAGSYQTTSYAPWVPWGTAGRLFSTAADMVRFLEANVGVTTIDGRPVPPVILDGMKQALLPRTAMTKESASRQGFAWVVWPEELPVKSRVMGKDGGIGGVSAYIAVNPDLKLGVVTLTNMAGVPVQEATLDIMAQLQALALAPD